MVLLLPSLFLSLTCGIPHFINLDSAVSFSRVTSNEDLISYRVRITEKGMGKIDELGAKPTLKFFYTFSTNKITNAPPSSRHNDGYELSRIRSLFSTNMKGSMGNGVLWSPESPNSAPGFYLYTKDNNSINNFARTSKAITNRHAEESGILVGTFAQSDDNINYSFGTAPEMDLPLTTIAAYGGSGTYEFNFSLEREELPNGLLIKLESDGDDLYLRSHQKNLFPKDHESIENLIRENSDFYSDIVSDSQGGNLYLHIWVSLNGGAGQFTNVYWSPLTHIGALALF